MPVLEILKYPNPVLKEVSAPVERVYTVSAFIRDLVETMKASPGVGLAAPQLGITKRIIAVDVTPKHPGAGLIVLVNPEITSMTGSKVGREGCLSVPEYTANIRRAEEITIKGLGPDGGGPGETFNSKVPPVYNIEEIVIESSGFEAVALQHEIDHLDGILFIDRIANMKRDLFKRKVR
jgi:peptide deformylase